MLIDIHEPGQSPKTDSGHASVGIDLGTTNSLVAISNKGIQEIITDAEGNALLPSVVSYLEGGDVVVGEKNKKDSIRSIKRLMGKNYSDIKENDIAFDLGKNKKDSIIKFQVNNNELTPIEISAEILKALKARAEKELDNKVDRAVITVPAYFDDAARTATKDAAKLAGLEVLRLVNEPTAAALAYGLDNNAEGIYAVYDLGGGTFDISILKMERGVFQVIATGGDSSLGGDDFDAKIAEHIISLNNNIKRDDYPELLSLSREIKESLTKKTDGEWEFKGKKFSISREEFEGFVDEYVLSTIKIFKKALLDADISIDDIKGVVMVGGSTRVPLVQKKIKELVGDKLLTNVDPDKVVAIGAAIQAENLTQGSDNLLIDVTPLSLGLETMGEIVESIIPRNTPIPTSHSQKFTTYQDGQTGMKIHVLQGEREMVSKCRSLAEFELTDIPPMTAGAAIIEITFTVDADGLLTVSAREETTGKEQKIEVKPSYGLLPEEVEKMLKESMEYAREDITEKLLAESKLEAKTALNAIKTALKEDSDLLDSKGLKKIQDQISIIEELLSGDDRDSIDYQVQQLDRVASEFVEKRMNKRLGSMLEGKDIDEISEELKINGS